jgi:tRNA A37 methylthiotransferase MiaB
LKQRLSEEQASGSSHLATTEPSPRTAGARVGTFAIETYGCQMNVSDSEIVRSILVSNGWEEMLMPTTEMRDIQRIVQQHKRGVAAPAVTIPDVTLLNTCAIRENAENRIWQRLDSLNALRRATHGSVPLPPLR